MSSTIVLNSSNIVSGSNNSSLIYNFPNSVKFSNHQIAVQSVSLYYSWTNINTTPLQNNTFTYVWRVGVTNTTYTITIPDGLYEIADINAFLQFRMIMNGTYLINSSSQNVYYAEFIVNPNTYAINIITYPVPTTLPSGWTAPTANIATGAAAFVGFPSTTFNPTITLPSNFNLIMGYAAGFATLPNLGVGTILTYTSSVAPQISPNPNALVSVSNISNIYASPSSIIYNITPDVGFGELIKSQPSEYAFNNLIKGTINSLLVRLIGQDGQALNIIDNNIVILLLIREAPMIGY